MDNFAVFILTNGRPDNVITYQTLKDGGYTGKIYIIIDNLDVTIDRYKAIYGDKVIVFNKLAISKTFDTADNFNDMRSIVYARNASFAIAKKLGLTHFIQLDDDYPRFMFRFNSELEFQYQPIKNLDSIFKILLTFFCATPIKTIAMSQGGDFIGGGEGTFGKQIFLKRKAMNSFICSTDRPIQFIGRINEDVNTYTHNGSIGDLFFTTCQIMLVQLQTQSNQGGMTELYLDSGTYIKSFYSVMFQPSSVKIRLLNCSSPRLHHSITWKNTVPQILSEDLRKVSAAPAQ